MAETPKTWHDFQQAALDDPILDAAVVREKLGLCTREEAAISAALELSQWRHKLKTLTRYDAQQNVTADGQWVRYDDLAERLHG